MNPKLVYPDPTPDHEHTCGTSRRLRAMLRERDAELSLARGSLKNAVKACDEYRERLSKAYDILDAAMQPGAADQPHDAMVTYHGSDPRQRFRQYKKDPLPPWAQDVQDEQPAGFNKCEIDLACTAPECSCPRK